MVYNTADNNYGVAKWIVDPTSGSGTHTTIATALTSASSGETIFIRPGTYTENITLKAGVCLTAFECNAVQPSVTIVGTLTATFIGTASISGIQIQTNSSQFLAVTGSSATIINIKSCLLNCANSSGISYTSSSSSSAINIYDSLVALTASNTLFVSTGSGTISMNNVTPANTTKITTASTHTTGTLLFTNCSFQFPITLTSFGTASVFFGCQFILTDTTVLTTVTSGTLTCRACVLVSGTASAVSIGASTTVNLFECGISTGNTNGVTGSGTAVMNPISWENVGDTVNASTITDKALGRVGTYTPTLSFSGASVGITYSDQTGNYLKIGKAVFFHFNVQLTNKGSSVGDARITLPFTPVQQFYFAAIVNTNTGQIVGNYIVAIGETAGYATFGSININTGFTGRLGSTSSFNNTQFTGDGVYWTA